MKMNISTWLNDLISAWRKWIISTIAGKMDNENDIWINSKLTTATAIQVELNLKKETLPLVEQIPKEFHEFLDVFSEEKAACFTEPRTWDHKIKMKDTFVSKSFKTYNLTPYNLEEQLKLDKFLEENLEKYIWLLLCLSLLPMDERWSQQVWIQGQGASCLTYHCDK